MSDQSYDVPPFLFRAASDQSRGINNAQMIDPLAQHVDATPYRNTLQDIEVALPDYRQAKHMVENHMSYHYQVASEFSSWSVSILYVLVHAIRKALSMKETDVRIYVLNTNRVSASRIYRARSLLKKYGLQLDEKLMNYAVGEYLVHGRLRNTNGLRLWKTASLDDLIDAGLWKAFPELVDPEKHHYLPGRVRQLRMLYFNFTGLPSGDWQINLLYNLAELFGSFGGIVLVALVTLKSRTWSPQRILNLVHEMGLMQLPRLSSPISWFLMPSLVIDNEMLEAKQFYEVLRVLNDKQIADEANDLRKALERHTLEPVKTPSQATLSNGSTQSSQSRKRSRGTDGSPVIREVVDLTEEE